MVGKMKNIVCFPFKKINTNMVPVKKKKKIRKATKREKKSDALCELLASGSHRLLKGY